jgi:HIRAN domain
MKEEYATITGMNHYYGLQPFKVGKKLKCIKEPSNPYDSEAIKVVIKDIGKVGYVANSPFTKATGTLGASGIRGYVNKKFKVEVMFITSSKVICRVVDGFKRKGKFAQKASMAETELTRPEREDDANVEAAILSSCDKMART